MKDEEIDLIAQRCTQEAFLALMLECITSGRKVSIEDFATAMHSEVIQAFLSLPKWSAQDRLRLEVACTNHLDRVIGIAQAFSKRSQNES